MEGRIAGAVPPRDIFRFGDKIKAGEVCGLIFGHEGLFWFSQNIHDGYLLDFCLLGGEMKGPIAGPGVRVVSVIIGFQCSVNPIRCCTCSLLHGLLRHMDVAAGRYGRSMSQGLLDLEFITARIGQERRVRMA
jgi:hypothetical protein